MKNTGILLIFLIVFLSLAEKSAWALDSYDQQTIWYCEIEIELEGDIEQSYIDEEEHLEDESQISCHTITEKKQKTVTYPVKVIFTGELNFGFTSESKFEGKLFTFIHNLPKSFYGDYYFSMPYAQVFEGEHIEIWAESLHDRRNFVFNLNLLSDISITSPLKSFIKSARMTLEKPGKLTHDLKK